MLKGHVQIDIHNHNSGFTERFEQDNMVTNALNYVIPNYIGGNVRPNDDNGIMPLAKRALGGLMLFDGALTEDANNIHFPSEAHLIAFAGQETNTSNRYGGSINTSESKELDTGYQNVWDFSTSQANGTIHSLALTNYYCNPFYGANAAGPNLHFIRRQNGDSYGNENPLIYDETNQIMYFIGDYNGYERTSDWNSDTRKYTYHFKFTVYKEYIPTNKYKVSDSANRSNYPESVAEINYDIQDFGDDPRNYVLNGYDGYAYIVNTYQNTSGDGTVIYRKIKLSDYSFELSDPVTVTVKNCSLYGGFANAIVNKGKLILRGYNGRYLYMVDLSNTANVQQVDLGEGHWKADSYSFANYKNGCVKFVDVTNSSSDSRYYCSDALLYPDGWVLTDAPYYEGTSTDRSYQHEWFQYDADNLLVWGWHNSNWQSYAFPSNNYLGTICNLSSGVTKTPASSMKVIYTLTDVDE